MAELPPSPSPAPQLLPDASITSSDGNAPMSFLELHATTQLPWHERAYADGPRPVPPRIRWGGLPRPPRAIDPKLPQADTQQEQQQQQQTEGEYDQPKPIRKRRRTLPTRYERLRDVDWSKRDPHLLDAVTRRVVSDYARCLCVQCTIQQRVQQPAPAFRCPVRYCGFQFDDFVALCEHQVDEHGRIYPQCRRVRMELFKQEHGAAPFPPATVYVGQQFLNPAVRPMEWTLARVDEEMRWLHAHLFNSKKHRLGTMHIWDLFTMAYHQVRQGGQAQLHAQYELALDHYQSALVHPVATRSFQDGSDAVGGGRNWLLSSEVENAVNVTPFRLELAKLERQEQNFGFSDDDDADDGAEPSSLLLLETGERVEEIKTSVVPEVVAATAAALPRDMVKRLEAVRPWQKLLEPQDSKVAAAIKVRKDVRAYKAPRCPDCHRILAKNSVCLCKLPPKPRKKHRPKHCGICGVAGHTRVTCPDWASADPAVKAPVMRCRRCGLLGHTGRVCVQVQAFDVPGTLLEP